MSRKKNLMPALIEGEELSQNNLPTEFLCSSVERIYDSLHSLGLEEGEELADRIIVIFEVVRESLQDVANQFSLLSSQEHFFNSQLELKSPIRIQNLANSVNESLIYVLELFSEEKKNKAEQAIIANSNLLIEISEQSQYPESNQFLELVSRFLECNEQNLSHLQAELSKFEAATHECFNLAYRLRLKLERIQTAQVFREQINLHPNIFSSDEFSFDTSSLQKDIPNDVSEIETDFQLLEQYSQKIKTQLDLFTKPFDRASVIWVNHNLPDTQASMNFFKYLPKIAQLKDKHQKVEARYQKLCASLEEIIFDEKSKTKVFFESAKKKTPVIVSPDHGNALIVADPCELPITPSLLLESEKGSLICEILFRLLKVDPIPYCQKNNPLPDPLNFVTLSQLQNAIHEVYGFTFETEDIQVAISQLLDSPQSPILLNQFFEESCLQLNPEFQQVLKLKRSFLTVEQNEVLVGIKNHLRENSENIPSSTYAFQILNA